MDAGIRCSYPVTGFSHFRRVLARTRHHLTQDTGAVFLLPNPVISRESLVAPGGFPAGSYRKLLEPVFGIINLGSHVKIILTALDFSMDKF
jgi:hypothetical protein